MNVLLWCICIRVCALQGRCVHGGQHASEEAAANEAWRLYYELYNLPWTKPPRLQLISGLKQPPTAASSPRHGAAAVNHSTSMLQEDGHAGSSARQHMQQQVLRQQHHAAAGVGMLSHATDGLTAPQTGLSAQPAAAAGALRPPSASPFAAEAGHAEQPPARDSPRHSNPASGLAHSESGSEESEGDHAEQDRRPDKQRGTGQQHVMPVLPPYLPGKGRLIRGCYALEHGPWRVRLRVPVCRGCLRPHCTWLPDLADLLNLSAWCRMPQVCLQQAVSMTRGRSHAWLDGLSACQDAHNSWQHA